MAIRVVRLGTDRAPDEGLRIGTVRRPPRGVRKERFAADNWYDVWFPTLSPSAETVKVAQAATTPAQWEAFRKRYLSEMAHPDAEHAIDLLAAMSHRVNFSVGCYCEREDHCHRSVLRALLLERGAAVQ